MPGDTKTNFTDARRKSFKEKDNIYGERIAKSIAVMEHDERNGMPPICVAKTILKVLGKKRPPVLTAVGFQYKAFLFLNKILPKKLVIFIIGKIYG
jgi:short-subunit dehydrogenase